MQSAIALCITEMKTLEDFGWNNYQHNKSGNTTEFKPARIVSIQGFKYYLVTDHGDLEAELSGRLLYGTEPEDIPKVGDWVEYLDYDTMGYIVNLLPRMNELSRKNPGTKTVRQVMASNIDGALVVQGLDRDFNIHRLQRYLVQLDACSIKPIVILNKMDLVDDPDIFRIQVDGLKYGCPVYLCSTFSGKGIPEIAKDVLEPRKTYIMIGSSGVGKSSILNTLLEADVQKTNVISDFNNKGKHTTTTRDLFQLLNGSLMIDSPGMREFGLTGPTDETINFPVIDELAMNCHFSDCKHVKEAGCAVLGALENGTLGADIYDRYVKLMKEQRRFEIKIEDKKRIERQFGKLTREASSHRKKYKY